MAVANFLKNYDVILFDMDGVITSEQNYWNAAALTVHEFLNDKAYMGKGSIDTEMCMKDYPQIRRDLFCKDELIVVLKNKGVNSNWDLAYVTVCIQLILDRPSDTNLVLEYAKGLSDNILNDYELLAQQVSEKCKLPLEYCLRTGEFWKTLTNLFQGWYLGNEKKSGLIHGEVPIIPVERLQRIISELKVAGKSLGYGTGRMAYEVIEPLTNWSLLDSFDENRRITYDDVTRDEVFLRSKNIEIALTKPHPFMFLKGAFGFDYPVEKLLEKDYDASELKRVLVVGDAGADILAAHAADIDFCCVLTGVNGQKARPFFEEQKSEYILDSIENFLT